MKTPILVVAIAACALSAPIVSAQEKAAPAQPAMSMNMDKQMPQMQEKMQAMQGQMDNIRQTTDPKERQKLMQEHMQAMQESMTMMRGLGGPMMSGGGQRGDMPMGEHKDMAGGDMMKGDGMMMEQMMQHDQMMESMPAG